MAILINRNDRIIVQGITGAVGSNFASRALQMGTPVVGGVTPGKGGQTAAGLPVFDTVVQAREALGATASFLAVPASLVKDAVLEGVDASLHLLVAYNEHTPMKDAMLMCSYARARGTVLLGPNASGCVTPGQANMSDLNDANLKPGRVGVVSKSATLSYEASFGLTKSGLGQSTVVCIGGDPIAGTDHADILERFEADPETEAVVMIGEIGGKGEFRAAEVVRRMTKPVVAYISGRWAPRGKRMGHAGAIIGQDRETADAKIAALRDAGAIVADQIIQVASLAAQALER